MKQMAWKLSGLIKVKKKKDPSKCKCERTGFLIPSGVMVML